MKPVIRVVFMDVNKRPVVRDIGTELEDMQAVIGGGYIEVLALTPDLDLIFDEDGIAKDLPLNQIVRTPRGEFHILGPCFIAAHDGGGDNVSLTNEQILFVEGFFRR